jgi:hypothetical protein
MSLTKTLLAGAAISALMATSASAFVGSVTNMHLVQGSPGAEALQLKAAHHKTKIPPQKRLQLYTYTVTISMLVPPDERYPMPLPSYAWVNSKTCKQSGKTDMGYSKDKVASIRVTTSTGPTKACPDDKFTFYGGKYTLENKKAKHDSFVGKLKDKHTTSGFNLTLVENFDFTFKKKK